jgi:23S rRNA (cytidine1920-2'-O)/16S rRNA (cytidine1409-2'-O)-methyltransferase
VAALIKPQFEAGREKVGKSGVVRDPDVHKDVLRAVTDAADGLGFGVKGLTYSPITGGEGNIEFLALFAMNASEPNMLSASAVSELIDETVAKAAEAF